MLRSPFTGKAICHCLLLEDKNGLALVDTGFGLTEIRNPIKYIGQELIDAFVIEFDENHTAFRQIEKMGLNTGDVKHCIISHLDFDHAGGLADFPAANVHISREEYDSFKNGNPRYLSTQFVHKPIFKVHEHSNTSWYGLPARKIEMGFESDIFLIPLFGHTLGQCGVAIEQDGNWLFYVADAFFAKAELSTWNHPVTQAAANGAENDSLRLESFQMLQHLSAARTDIEIFCYHDPTALKYN
jgi:glyoxylase-like metal-dependent hydrolase (beta-lactamase superfamily II)